jgi:hypothetical protein
MPVQMRAYIIFLRLANTPHPQTEEEEGIKHNKVVGTYTISSKAVAI